jgi:hypothetical protein
MSKVDMKFCQSAVSEHKNSDQNHREIFMNCCPFWLLLIQEIARCAQNIREQQ